MAWREVIISYYGLMISPRTAHIIQYQPVRLEVIKERIASKVYSAAKPAVNPISSYI